MDDHQHDQHSQHRDDEPQQDQHDQFPGGINVTFIVTGNATVGSQHDVHHGDYHADQQAHLDRAAARTARAHARMRRAQDRTGSHADTDSTSNVAAGNDIVHQQVGWNFGSTTYTNHSGNAAPQ